MFFKVPEANVLRKEKSLKWFHRTWPYNMKEKWYVFSFCIEKSLLLTQIKTTLNHLNVCYTGRKTNGLILRNSCKEMVSLNRLKPYLSEVDKKSSISTLSRKKIVYRPIKLAKKHYNLIKFRLQCNQKSSKDVKSLSINLLKTRTYNLQHFPCFFKQKK